MRSRWVPLIALACIAAQAHTQSPASSAAAPDPCAAHSPVAFDVASIKPSDKPAGGSSMHNRGDSLTWSGVLRRLILYAYDLRDFQVTGGPDWVSTQVWEVGAKVDPPEPDFATLDDAHRQEALDRSRQRLQSLLADRFHFQCHIAAKEVPIYELIPAKGGAKLTPTTVPLDKQGSMSSNGNDRSVKLVATGIGLSGLTRYLSSEVGRSVVDKTGLSGSYDIAMTWMPAMASTQEGDAASGPTIFTALEEQIGLKLVPAKGPVPVLVIDSVEKPSEN